MAARIKGTLVVIDMQPLFKASSAPRLVDSVGKCITAGRAAQLDIVVLEYHESGATNPKVLLPLLAPSRYERFQVLEKYCDDGSIWVRQACHKLGYSNQRFYLCGVNISACVKSTAVGLKREYPEADIAVLVEACGDKKDDPWSAFPRFDGLRLIPNLESDLHPHS